MCADFKEFFIHCGGIFGFGEDLLFYIFVLRVEVLEIGYGYIGLSISYVKELPKYPYKASLPRPLFI